jgi:hypothetical protein
MLDACGIVSSSNASRSDPPVVEKSALVSQTSVVRPENFYTNKKGRLKLRERFPQ